MASLESTIADVVAQPEVETPSSPLFDFYDFGTSKGGAMAWATAAFGGRGCGIDIDPLKVEKAVSGGFDAVVADLSGPLDLPPVRFVVMSHFLEHLPDMDVGDRIISNACKLAREFVVMRGPDFEASEYLKGLGVKKYYADWSGHSWMHTIGEFKRILNRIGLPYKIAQSQRIFDTYDRTLLPLDARRNSGPFNPEQHSEKPYHTITGRVFSELSFVVQTGKQEIIDGVLLRAAGARVL